MDFFFWIEVVNKFVISFFFLLFASKFMRRGWVTKFCCFTCLVFVQIVFIPLPVFFGVLAFLACIIIIAIFINAHLKDYLKSFNIALSIVIVFMIIGLTLGSVMLIIFSHFFSFENLTYNILMQVSTLVFAIALRKHSDFLFKLTVDVKLLKFSLTIKILLFTILNFIIPLLFAINVDSRIYLAIVFIFTTLIIVGFLCIEYMSRRTQELEYKSRKAAIELTRRSVESENINRRYEEIIRFKHFCTSVNRSIIAYINANDMQGLKEYYDKHIAPVNEQLDKELGEYEQLKHIHLDLIKARMIELINTVSQLPNVNLYIHLDNIITSVAIKEIDLFTILNIFIDNAVEETRTQEKGEITIEMTQTHDCFIFKIKNTLNGYESTPKPQNTHKGNDIVFEICERYPNIVVSTKIEYGMYIKSVVISSD